MLRLQDHRKWEDFYEPAAELSGALSTPQVYVDYMKKKKQSDKKTSAKEAEANSYVDPNKGLVDAKTGRVLIPIDKITSQMGISGFAIST